MDPEFDRSSAIEALIERIALADATFVGDLTATDEVLLPLDEWESITEEARAARDAPVGDFEGVSRSLPELQAALQEAWADVAGAVLLADGVVRRTGRVAVLDAWRWADLLRIAFVTRARMAADWEELGPGRGLAVMVGAAQMASAPLPDDAEIELLSPDEPDARVTTNDAVIVPGYLWRSVLREGLRELAGVRGGGQGAAVAGTEDDIAGTVIGEMHGRTVAVDEVAGLLADLLNEDDTEGLAFTTLQGLVDSGMAAWGLHDGDLYCTVSEAGDDERMLARRHAQGIARLVEEGPHREAALREAEARPDVVRLAMRLETAHGTVRALEERRRREGTEAVDDATYEEAVTSLGEAREEYLERFRRARDAILRRRVGEARRRADGGSPRR